MSIHPFKIAGLLLLAGNVYGAIAFDAAASNGTPSANPVTWTHTCTGSNLVLYVGVDVHIPLGGSITSASYNGVAMTLIISTQGSNGVSNTGFLNGIFYLANPATGAHTVSVSFAGGAASAEGGSISLTGVDQTTPVDASSCTTSVTGEPSVTLTTIANNSWALDNVDSFSGTATVGAGQTAQWNNALNSGSSIGPITPAGATTMTWSGLSVGWAQCAASFCPVGCTVASAKGDPLYLLMHGSD